MLIARHVCFFAPVRDPAILQYNSFYANDLAILRGLSEKVSVCTRWWQLPVKAELYFVWWWSWAFLPQGIASLTRRPVLITGALEIDNPMPGEAFADRPWYERRLITRSYRTATMNMPITDFEHRAARRQFGNAPALMCPLAIDHELYAPSHVPREHFLLTIAWLSGTNGERKGVDLAIRAHAELLQHDPNLALVIAGDCLGGEASLMQLARELGSRQHVHFVGRVSTARKVELLQTCAAFLQLSVHEGFGVAAAEALACGTPVVATHDSGALPEVLGDAAHYVSRNPDEAADGIRRVLAIPDSARAVRGREHVITHYSLQRRTTCVRKVVQQLLINGEG